MNNIEAAREFLNQAQNLDGGWSYRVGAQSSPEPTCYSLLALSIADFSLRPTETKGPSATRHPPSAIERGLRWLELNLRSDGSITLMGDEDPHWSASLVAITLMRLQPGSALKASVIQWLLSWQGRSIPSGPEILLDDKLVGWPWLSDTFSWVEPTSYAVLALKLAGQGGHPRVNEAERLLLDRVCSGGGWNYGNRVVFGRALVPFLPTTALALLALQDVARSPSSREIRNKSETQNSNDQNTLPNISDFEIRNSKFPAGGDASVSQKVEQSLSWLNREIQQNQSALALALTILCLNALDQPVDGFASALVKRQQPDGSWRQAVHLTALALLALTCAMGGPNVFKL